MTDDPYDYIAEAITVHWGERCPDYEPQCACCAAWAQYDALKARVAIPEGWRCVPIEPTEAQWGGLARKMMLAWDADAKAPRRFFAMLLGLGAQIPQWIRDEPEMQIPEHVPSKGTRAAILYRAMLEDAPELPNDPA